MKKGWNVFVIVVIVGSSLLYGFNKASVVNDNRKSGSSIKVLEKWQLPEILREVSGIEYLGNSRFACIQDEIGTIFIYNTAAGKIEKEIPFGGPGDFEGIAIAGTTAYAVQSDGKIFEVTNYESAKPVVKHYTTSLTAKHNVEGLTYDKVNNRLLLAIKGEEPNSREYKGVYAFDLKSRQFAATPVVRINLTDPLFGEVKEKKRKSSMQPSEIEIHPVSNDLYILEGVNPKLLIMDAHGNKKKLYEMPRNVFPQAEGLAFSPQGELFISNEGKNGAATIVKVAID